MYELNDTTLPVGDALAVFADLIAQIERLVASDRSSTGLAGDAFQPAMRGAQRYFAAICRRLLLPGSAVIGFENLAELTRLADTGCACLLCLNHLSTLDVPTLYTLIEDQADPGVFDRIVWIAGRKLSEDHGLTPILARCFHRVVVTQKSWMARCCSDQELREARRLNWRAYRTMRRLRREGWVIGLFPTGTRLRPGDAATARAVDEIDSYLKYSDYLVLGNIDGCTLPVTRDHDLTREIPRSDRVVYTFGPVVRCADLRVRAAGRHPTLNQRAASARAIIDDILALRSSPH